MCTGIWIIIGIILLVGFYIYIQLKPSEIPIFTKEENERMGKKEIALIDIDKVSYLYHNGIKSIYLKESGERLYIKHWIDIDDSYDVIDSDDIEWAEIYFERDGQKIMVAHYCNGWEYDIAKPYYSDKDMYLVEVVGAKIEDAYNEVKHGKNKDKEWAKSILDKEGVED